MISDDRARRCGGGCAALKREAQVNAKKVVGLLLLAFVLFFIITQPETSADIVRSTFRGLSNVASAIADFITNLV